MFERFTSAARDAINSGIEHARKLNDGYVEPLHLLLGVLEATVGLVARIRMHYGWDSQLTRLVQPRYPQINQQLWTDIFSREARRILAEDVLILAGRMDHPAVSTGHLLIASLECPDERSLAITATLPDVRELAEAVIDLLPDEEEA